MTYVTQRTHDKLRTQITTAKADATAVYSQSTVVINPHLARLYKQ